MAFVVKNFHRFADELDTKACDSSCWEETSRFNAGAVVARGSRIKPSSLVVEKRPSSPAPPFCLFGFSNPLRCSFLFVWCCAACRMFKMPVRSTVRLERQLRYAHGLTEGSTPSSRTSGLFFTQSTSQMSRGGKSPYQGISGIRYGYLRPNNNIYSHGYNLPTAGVLG